jgi:hypothetical protein
MSQLAPHHFVGNFSFQSKRFFPGAYQHHHHQQQQPQQQEEEEEEEKEEEEKPEQKVEPAISPNTRTYISLH